MRILFLPFLAWAVVPLVAGAQPATLHPAFPVLDDAGKPWVETHAEPSSDRTCGACHDAAFVDRTDSHRRAGHKAPCVQCHLAGSRFPSDPAAYDPQGRIRAESLRPSAPTNAHCASCHGIVHSGPEPVSIPDDFEAVSTGPAGDRTYGITFGTGEVLSPQDVSESWLNLSDKAGRNQPWDVHARRVLLCTSCHYSRNNPARAGVKDDAVATLVRDPRRISTSEYLLRPDHDLATANCRSCHDPDRAHDFLPDRKRHLDALDCRACHVPNLAGPAARAIDATVTTLAGGPAVEYRGLDRRPGESLNSAYGHGYEPFLLPRAEAGGTRLAPFNVVTRWSWVSEGTEVPYDRVKAAWLSGGRYSPEVLRVLDANRDGILDDGELRLDAGGAAVIRDRLLALGVKEPVIRAELVPNPVAHGVVDGKRAVRDCATCHSPVSRLASLIPLSGRVPGGVLPALPDSPSVMLAGAVEAQPDGGLVLRRRPADSTYAFGHSRDSWSGPAGFGVFLAVVAGVLAHAGLRFFHRRRRTEPAPGPRAYLYPAYERLWHWLMAVSVVVLLVTGFVIHAGGGDGFASAVKVHDFFAAVMVANAALSLFYHLATAAIRRFVPPRENLAGEVAAQTRFYLRDIFRGLPHPVPRTAERRLNPLQQLTYLALLNGLFPFQIATGILIWGASRWPDLAADLGGLAVVGPLHHLGSWLFLSFFVLHVYLTTTGPTVTAHVRSMLDGWGEVEGGKK